MSRKLLDYAMQIVAAEEAARLISAKLPRKLVLEVPEGKPPVIEVHPVVQTKPTPSFVVDMRGVDIEGTKVLVDEKGYGKIQELLVVATDTDFSVKVRKDDEWILTRSYTEYEEISQYLEEVDAFESNGTYIVKINDIEFERNIRVEVVTESEVHFDLLFVKYKISRSF